MCQVVPGEIKWTISKPTVFIHSLDWGLPQRKASQINQHSSMTVATTRASISIVRDTTDKMTFISIIQHAGSLQSASKILVPALTASHLLLSSCTLIIGLLLGSCSQRCCRKKAEFSTDKKLAEEPVYSEIPPKAVPPVCHLSESVKSVDNVVYGQVSP